MARRPLLDSRKVPQRVAVAKAIASARKAGRPFASQIADMIWLRRRPSRLSAMEYYKFRLYEPTRTASERAEYVGSRRQRAIYSALLDRGWAAVANDKLLYYAIMTGLGFAVPRIVAVCHPYRGFPGAATFATPGAIAAFLRQADYPLFGKPIAGRHSVGTVALTGYDAAADTVKSATEEEAKVEDFVDDLAAFARDGYLFQERLVAHPFVREACGERIATVRATVLLEAGGPTILCALWRLPGGANIADNFWRPGNLLAALDGVTGRITRVVVGFGPDQRLLEAHPDTGFRLVGAVLPEWAVITRMLLKSAAAFPGILLQAWDVALTDRGPMLLELNFMGDVSLPQHAFGEGIYRGRLKAALEARAARLR